MNTYNHKLSRAIINFAIQNNAGVIHFEDLGSLSEEKQKDMYLRDWNISDIISKTEYKAKECGIEVHKINPAYTSQRCSKCGHIDEKNRKSQSEFKCTQCGHEENADFNASRNIALLDVNSSLKIES